MKRVLFLCTGNFYRSRLAEMLFNHYAANSGLEWRAESRGFAPQKQVKGLSPSAMKYLETLELGHLHLTGRNPTTLSVDDLPKADLVILLNRSEHLPMMQRKFSWMIQVLEKEGKLRAWNIYDLPVDVAPMSQLLGFGTAASGQPPESGTEHVDFAVRALVSELSGK